MAPAFAFAVDNSTFSTQTVAANMIAGTTQNVIVTFTNPAGSGTTWTTTGTSIYKLGSQNPQDNTTWGLNRVSLPPNVAPGGTGTFTFTITAPTTPGNYAFQWKMLKVAGTTTTWFGALSTSVQINVLPKVTAVSDPTTPEGGYCTFTVTLSAPIPAGGKAFTLSTATVASNQALPVGKTEATSGLDYSTALEYLPSRTAFIPVPVNGNVTIPAGSSFQVRVKTLTDNVTDNNEMFSLNVLELSAAGNRKDYGLCTITDVPAALPAISAVGDPVVAEGQSCVFDVSLSGPTPAGGSTFALALATGSSNQALPAGVTDASPTDYLPGLEYSTNNRVTFSPVTGGSVTVNGPFSVRVATVADNIPEGDEMFSLNVTPGAGTSGVKTYGLCRITNVTNSACTAPTSSTVTPTIATKGDWDAKFSAAGWTATNLPDVEALSDSSSTAGASFAWHGHYWLRSYASMAKIYGDTKYLDWSVRTIDYWFTQATPTGWTGSDTAGTFLQTAQIANAIAHFSYVVWSDARFTGTSANGINYRAKADSYVAQLEAMLQSYDWQWVDNTTTIQSPLYPNVYFYRYRDNNPVQILSENSPLMYNQGATMVKALFLIDRIKRLKSLVPDAGYLDKTNKAAAYFKTFATLTPSGGYTWNYGGAVTDPAVATVEDVNHGHLDLNLLYAAGKYSLGGFTTTDMSRLAITMQKVLNGTPGPTDVSCKVDGTGSPFLSSSNGTCDLVNTSDNWRRVPVGIDWIDLVDYDATLLDKVINVYNTRLGTVGGSRFMLGWAEIQRKKACVNILQ
jgi:hypothetical protein